MHIMNNKRRILSCLIASLLIVCFFDFSVKNGNVVILSGSNALISTCVFLVSFMFLNCLIEKRRPTKTIDTIILFIVCAFFSIVCVSDKFYKSKEAIDLWRFFLSRTNTVFLIIEFIGGCSFFYLVFLLIDAFLGYDFNRLSVIPSSITGFLFKENKKYRCIAVILICWLPVLILRYPGAVTADAWKSIGQFAGITPMTNQHTMVFIYVYGWLYQCLTGFAGFELGIFIIIFLQVIIFALVLSYTLWVLHGLNINRNICFIVFFAFAVLPCFTERAMTISQDSLYCVGFLLAFDETALLAFNSSFYFQRKIRFFLLPLSFFFMMFRTNGFLFSCVFSVVIMSFCTLYVVKKQIGRRVFLLLTAVLLVVIIAGRQGNSYLLKKSNANIVSGRVMLAMPLQQISRSIINHPNDMSADDWQALQSVFNLTEEEIIKSYNPKTFDPLKSSYNTKRTKNDLLNFLRLWLKRLVFHPRVCISATLEQTYYMFDPFVENIRIQYATYDPDNSICKKLGINDMYHPTSIRLKMQKWIQTFYLFMAKLPVLGLFINESTYTIMLLFTVLSLLFRRKWKSLLLSFPLLMTLAITFAGPQCVSHPRYLYPVFYSFPAFFALSQDVFFNINENR